MKLNHDDIKEQLPGYIRDNVIPDEVASHLKECHECSLEAALLRDLNDMPVPEPGGMFFETLPQKVRTSLREQKRGIFFRLAPVFASLALVAVAGYLFYSLKTPDTTGEMYAFTDPLAPKVYDLSVLTEDDIPLLGDSLKGDEMYITDETSFLREFAYLSSEEIEALYEALTIQQGNGGV
jgi:hypothetical protein